MVAPPYQATVFYRKANSAGWTETYWMMQTSYSTVATALGAIVNARMAMQMNDIFCDGYRISDPFVFRDVWLSNFTSPLVGSWTAGTGETSGPAEMGLRVQQFSGVRPWSIKFLHGLPSLQYSGNTFTPSTSFATALQAWVQLVEQDCALIIRKGVVPPGPYGNLPINAMVPKGVRSHRVGRPTTLFHGRRPPR